MLRRHILVAGLALAAFGSAFPAFAQSKGPVIGVSWSNFQEERWKTDEAAIKAAIEKVGGTYLSADAQSSPAKQLTDVESLIARGAKAIIVLAQDAQAIRPAVQKAVDEANKAVSRAESIRSFRILPEDFTEAGGELTPSLKLKRSVVMKAYASEVAAIYA